MLAAGAAFIAAAIAVHCRTTTGEQAALRAFRSRARRIPLTIRGEVVRTLPDDQRTPRHQRFIIETSTGQTLLVLRNIDVAQRVPLNAGDEVEVRGEYVYNPQGGLIHQVHRNPSGKGLNGWIRVLSTGRLYP